MKIRKVSSYLFIPELRHILVPLNNFKREIQCKRLMESLLFSPTWLRKQLWYMEARRWWMVAALYW